MFIQLICICTHPPVCARYANRSTCSLCPVLSKGALLPNCLASVFCSSLLGIVDSANRAIIVVPPNSLHVFRSPFKSPISDPVPIETTAQVTFTNTRMIQPLELFAVVA